MGGTPNNGTVFELSPNGTGGWNEAPLHSFGGNPYDGQAPYDLVRDSVGNLYGFTQDGGTHGCCKGIVFKLHP